MPSASPTERRGQRRRSGQRTAQRSRPGRTGIRALVLEFVASNPGATAGDVAKGLGLNRNSVATRLAQLAKAGELAKAKRGYRTP
jgi:hypothetical protein